LEAKMSVRPFYLKGFWYDVGTTEAYEKLDDTVERHLGFLGYPPNRVHSDFLLETMPPRFF